MKKVRLFLILFLLITGHLRLSAQWYDPEKVSKKVSLINEKAYNAAMDGNYKDAMQLLNDAIKEDGRFVDGFLSRAGVYANMKDYTSSVRDFETALQMDSVYSKTFLLPYSISLAGTGNFEKALRTVNEFLANPTLNEQSVKAGNYRKSTYEFALEWAKEHSSTYKFEPKHLSPNVNSTALEYYPTLTIDGKKLIFTRRIKDEDMYESELVNGEWTPAVPVEGKINTNLNEAAQNISQDGTVMVFAGCLYPEGQGSCDLYISYKLKNGSWSEPENLGFNINTDAWESSPSLSPDKRDLYFASSRPGGYGGSDIWVSHKQSNGKWSNPQNMGRGINTAGNEGSPFIHADNQTLYFISSGLPGYGNSDLFITRKTDDGGWTEPENLGYPINTIDDEATISVASDGTTGYYSSDKSDTYGGLDIYTFQLRKDISALKTLWVKGKVFDVKTKEGLPCSVELTQLSTRNLLSKVQTDEDGNYLMSLPEGNDYAFNVNRKGYLFFSEHFALHNNPADSALVIDIPLQPLAPGAEIVLKNIFFDVKQYVLKTESYSELDRLVQLMTDNPKLTIEISGYTDNLGKPADNLVLSVNRAKSVANYLMAKGIDPKRITPKGYGETHPVMPNDTEAGKSRNRRTELHVISNS